MPIKFACPSCALQYSVKDELAGKSAKCGKCGHRMKIPAAAAIAAAASAKPAPAKPASAAPKSSAAPTAKPASASTKRAVAPTAKAAPKAPPSDPGVSSWLDEELESARVEAKSKPKPPPADASCPSCSGPLMPGAVVCMKCGYDTRIRGKRTVERVTDEQPKRSKLGAAASLLRGTFFSFLAAMLGAVIWALLAYLTTREFGIVAWGLGGLAGLGMALGHEDNDGTFAGIVAAFMSLVGIIAAKVFIVIIFIAAAVSTMVNEVERAPISNPTDMQRTALAMGLAMKDLQASGHATDDVDEAQWNAAFERAQERVADLSPDEVERQLSALAKAHGLDGEFEDDSVDDADDSDSDSFAADESIGEHDQIAGDASDGEPEASFGSVVGSLFGPMDGLFILLAFFTAYKVGSGQASD